MEALNSAEVKVRVATLMAEPAPTKPETFAAFVRAKLATEGSRNSHGGNGASGHGTGHPGGHGTQRHWCRATGEHCHPYAQARTRAAQACGALPGAVLIARIYKVLPLWCPLCGWQMRIIAFITHRADIRHILEHIGVQSEPPHITPARGPPLWESCDALAGERSQIGADLDLAAQPAPDF